MGFSDTEAEEEDVSDYPPNCYFYSGSSLRSLYFNTNGDSTDACNSGNKICICKIAPEPAVDVCGKACPQTMVYRDRLIHGAQVL